MPAVRMVSDRMPTSLQSWHAWFDAQTIERARTYADEGEVERVVRDGPAVQATVHGHQTYRLSIEAPGLAADGERGLVCGDLSSQCECPVGWRCKHAAAALIALARNLGVPDGLDEDQRPAATPRPSSGQRQPRGAPQPPAPALPVAQAQRDEQSMQVAAWLRAATHRDGSLAAEHQLCWHLLPPRPGGETRWRIGAVLAKRLKSGARGVGKRYPELTRALEQLAPTLGHAELHLLRRLAGLRHPHHAWEEGWLDSACGATGDLLQQLIAGGACHFEGFSNPPLRLGPTRRAELAWTGGKDGWRLEVRPAHGRIIPVDPPWWIDGIEAGPLETGLDAAAFDVLRTMPPVPLALLPTALPVLARLVPGLPDPPVAPAAVPPGGYLLPCRLRLAAPGGYPAGGIEVEALAVWLRYGEVLVEADGAAVARSPDGRTVVRDLPAEQALLAQLAGLGLATDADLRLVRGPGAPRAAVPVAIHRASCEEALRSGSAAVAMPPTVLAAARAAGWTIEGVASAAPDLAAEVIEVQVGEPEGIDWFELHLGIRLGDERIDLTPVIAQLVAGGAGARAALPRIELSGRSWLLMALPDGRLVRLPEDEVARIAARIEALFDAQPPPGRGWRVDRALALQIDDLAAGHAIAGERLGRLVAALRELAVPGEAAPPPGLSAELRPYQRVGLGWMQRLRACGVGGVLADDMGLGKTVQTIAFICAEHAEGRLDRPVLVVCPASLIGTWRAELARFAPGLSVAVLHGVDRLRDPDELLRRHVLITTYGTLLRDQDLFESIELHLAVCDEAQTIKNAAAKAGAAVRRLRARHRLALSGTPLENHLGELHTLMHWLVPGLLGDRSRFERVFRKPIEQDGDAGRAALLRARVAPFMLRRTKAQVAPELPPRTEAVVPLELTATQRELYESVRLAMDRRIREALVAKGLSRSRIDVLDALLKLRQVCCDPRLVRGSESTGAASAKLDWLSDTLPEMADEGRRVLVFSQFTSLLDLVESDVLRPANLPWLRLDGSSRDRQGLVERFQAGEAPVFLLSLKAGGTGLTLTMADTVILLDPWWNPAAEAQAADRAHRIGQDKPVFIYRPVCTGTVEERIQELQRRKKALADALWEGDGQGGAELTEEDIQALLAPLPG
jgi:superfamily II DNA or RNA helicase